MKIRKAEEKDFTELSVLLKEAFPFIPVYLWKHRFDMWWINNPAKDPSIPYGWILEDNKSEIVGFNGNIPVKYLINGKRGIAAAATSWYVKPQVRGIYSIKLMLEFTKQKNIDLFLNTTPSEKTKKMLPKIGFLHTDLPFNKTEYWYILNNTKVLKLILNKWVKSPRIFSFIRIISFPFKLAIDIIQRIKDKKIFQANQHKYRCSLCKCCDESFTKLWEIHKKTKATTLYRDEKNLNWLYFSSAVADKRFVIKCIDTEEDKLTGYFILDINCHSDENIKTMELMDTYLPEVEEKTLLSLISLSIDLAKKHDVAALRLWSINREMNNILKKLIKVRRKYRFGYFYKFNDAIKINLDSLDEHEFIPSPVDPDRGTL